MAEIGRVRFQCDTKALEDKLLLARLEMIEVQHRPSRFFHDSCECFAKGYREHINKLRMDVLNG